MRWIIALGLAALLAGCETAAERAFRESQEDDAKCISYGAKKGEAAYVQCRAQLDAARTGAKATIAAQPVVIVEQRALIQ